MKDFLKLKQKIGAMKHDKFETFCTHLFRKLYESEGTLHSGINWKGQGTKGTPDAFIRKKNDRYIVFEFSTTQNKSSQRKKVLNNINLLNSDKCWFADSIDEVVICINTGVHSEIDEYRRLVQSLGWRFDFYSLDILAKRVVENHYLFPDLLRNTGFVPSNSIDNILYDCGDRIRELREERELTRSEMLELVPLIGSEKFLEGIESKINECSSDAINLIHEITGANKDWIKHGKSTKYPKDWLYNYGYNEYLETFSRSQVSIRDSYFVVEPENMRMLIVLKFTDLKWKVFEFSANFKFWHWIDDHNKISSYFDALKFCYLSLQEFSHPKGLIIDTIGYSKLSDPMRFPGHQILKESNARQSGYYWIDDLFDAIADFPNIPKYAQNYGEWFEKLTQFFAEYRDSHHS